jgi:hypothetical protein
MAADAGRRIGSPHFCSNRFLRQLLRNYRMTSNSKLHDVQRDFDKTTLSFFEAPNAVTLKNFAKVAIAAIQHHHGGGPIAHPSVPKGSAASSTITPIESWKRLSATEKARFHAVSIIAKRLNPNR